MACQKKLRGSFTVLVKEVVASVQLLVEASRRRDDITN